MQDRAAESQFIGRERELGLLEAGLRDARARNGRALGIAGEPGIGKTRLVEEFARRSGLPADAVLWGRCPEQSGVPTYWPWRQALAQLIETGGPAGRGKKAGLDPAIQRALSLLTGDPEAGLAGSDTDSARFTLLDAVVRLLRTAGQRDALVIVLDDVHWADEASLRLLGHVCRELRGSHVLVLLTYREPEMRRRASVLGDLARFSRRIALRGLAREEVERFVSINGDVAPSPAMIARLHETTEGNPFFLDELITMLRASGELDSSDDAVASLDLPEGVREAIRHRISPLAADEQAQLTLAAVVGREFDVRVLELASEATTDAVLHRLAPAISAGLVQELSIPGHFRFAHALVRETLYAGLLPAARVAAHRRVALAMEKLFEQGLEIELAALAHHFFLAVPLGEAGKAAQWSERAGRVAMKQHAHDEAVAQFDRALAALGFAGDDPPRRTRLLLSCGEAAQRAGDTVRASEAFLRAARTARDQGDKVSLAIAAMRHSFARGAYLAADPSSVKLLESALTVLGEEDSPLRVFTLTSLSSALLFSRERARCLAIVAEAVAIARRLADATATSTALMASHLVRLGDEDAEGRLALIQEAIAIARSTGRTDSETAAWGLLINDLLELGDVGAAESESERFMQLADASRVPTIRWSGLVTRACLALLSGRFADAERLSAEAIAARRDAHDAAVVQIFVLQSFMRRLETGGVADHEEMIARFTSDFPDNRWRAALALLRAESGREDEAKSLFAEIAALDFDDLPKDANFLADCAVLGMLAHRLGDAARARKVHAMLTPYAARAVVVFIQPVVCLGAVARYLGLVAWAAGDLDQAARHFEDAIAANTRMGARPYLAHTQAEYGRMLLERDAPGDRERAAKLIGEARATASALGQHVLREKLASLDVGASSARAVEAAAIPAAQPARVEAPPGASIEAPGAAVAVLKRDGDLWKVAYRNDSFHLKDSKGLLFLSMLLRHPGREMHVLDLAGGSASDAGQAAGAGQELAIGDLGDAGELLDPAARQAYKRRLEDLRDELEEAERYNDVGRADRARQEIDFLSSELARGVGLGGRARRAASAAERARQNAYRTIAAALKKIAEGSPALGQHLAATVKTGLFCSYDPDAGPAIRWML